LVVGVVDVVSCGAECSYSVFPVLLKSVPRAEPEGGARHGGSSWETVTGARVGGRGRLPGLAHRKLGLWSLDKPYWAGDNGFSGRCV
jgi:hypothetical protein